MKTVRVMFRVQEPDTKQIGRIDPKRVDASSKAAIAKHQVLDKPTPYSMQLGLRDGLVGAWD